MSAKMEQEMKIINKLFKDNDMQLHGDKCKLMMMMQICTNQNQAYLKM